MKIRLRKLLLDVIFIIIISSIFWGIQFYYIDKKINELKIEVDYLVDYQLEKVDKEVDRVSTEIDRIENNINGLKELFNFF